MGAAVTRSRGRVAAPVPRRRQTATYTLVGIVTLLALLGAVIAAQQLRAGSGESSQQVEGTVSTSFGSLVVHQSEVLGGLSSSDLGGMSHGVQNLVASGKAEIAVTVTLTNKRAGRMRYDADQFRLVPGRKGPTGRPVAPLGTSLSSGTLARGGTVEGTVNFVTPTDGSDLWLQFDDGGRRVLVRIGATARPGASGAPTDGTEHSH
jgi:hypothetical protein